MFYYRRSPIYHHPLLSLLTPYSFEAATSSHPCGSGHCASGGCKALRSPKRSHSRFQYHVEHKEDESTILLDLPGVMDNEVKVEFHNGYVRIETNKHIFKFRVSEKRLDHEAIRADLANGVLTVTIPQKAVEAPRSIPVSLEYPTTEPTTDDDKSTRLSVDLPGVKAENLKLEIKDSTLSLHAKRYYGERVSSTDKHFTVDETKVDASTFNAYLANGVLTITGQRKESSEPAVRSIPVSVNSEDPPVAAAIDADEEPKETAAIAPEFDADATVAASNLAQTKADDFVVVETVEK
jgi:HSP20 family molecular chaperone IbpA